MKLAIVLFYFVLGSYAKNVFDLSILKGSLEDEQHEKRDAKNVLNIDRLKIGVPTKRDDWIDLDKLKIGVPVVKPHVEKRDQGVMHIQESKDTTLLQSILPQYRDISIFAGYIRDNQELDSKTNSLGDSMIVISPSDDAITNKLNGLKPWEFPDSLDGGNEDEIAASNLNYFISNHVSLDVADGKIENNVIKVKLLSGKTVKIVDGPIMKVIDDGREIKVSMSKQVDNGLILIIDDVLVKPN